MSKRYTGQNTAFYFAPKKVADLVNLSIELRRPLLVEGEPGCGKTMLAWSVAAELGLGEPVRVSIKSTSRARDLLYRFDAVRRLQDASGINGDRAQFIHPYISLGPLGEAIDGRGPRRVVLLDEIDKADIDFPNDVLDVLGEFAFMVEDLPAEEEEACRKKNGFGREVKSDPRPPPVVIITSNREKRLPEPFLRRCLFVQLQFPEKEDDLRNIVRKNIPALKAENEALLGAAVTAFCKIRHNSLGFPALKPPATSELIDWVKALCWDGTDAAALDAKPPPWSHILFKVQQDIDGFEASYKKSTSS
jgi:MoxR-like ATPase